MKYEVSLTLDIEAEDEDSATAAFWQNVEDDGRTMLVDVVEVEEDICDECGEVHTDCGGKENKEEGEQIKVHELPLFRRDFDDYEVGSEMWQAVMSHNIAVSLLTNKPLTKGEMSFIAIQNDHLKSIEGKK